MCVVCEPWRECIEAGTIWVLHDDFGAASDGSWSALRKSWSPLELSLYQPATI